MLQRVNPQIKDYVARQGKNIFENKIITLKKILCPL